MCVHTYSNCLLPEQVLQKSLSRTLVQIDEKYAEGDETGAVPPHLVNQKLGNRQQVLIGGGKTFGAWIMTEMLAKVKQLAYLHVVTYTHACIHTYIHTYIHT